MYRSLLKYFILWLLVISSNFGYAQTDSIDIFIKNKMREKGIPGLQLAIVRNNKIVRSGSYGLANVQDSILVTENTVFTINSMTKAFTGVAIMQLVEQRKIRLDDPIADHLDSLPDSWKQITLTQLLSHTSGLPEIMSDAKLISSEGEEASWKKVQGLPLDFKAGERFRYNQTNYVLLGKIIDKYAGSPFAEFIRKKQLQKAGMTRTCFGDFHDIIPNYARGYTYFKNGKLTNVFEEFSPFLRTAVGMSSTAKELAEWIIALQTNKLLKSKISLSALWTPALLNNSETGGFSSLLNGYAMGWPVALRSQHPAIVSIGGGRSGLFVYPDDNMSIIVLSNLQGASPESFIDEIAGFYIPEMKEANGFGHSAAVKLLRAELEKKGYKHAIEQANQLKTKSKQFGLTEDEVNSWGYKLMRQNRKADAVEIFKLNTILYPNSANTFDSLGEGYTEIGETKLAIQNYEKVLQLDPDNANATEQLKKLRSNQ